MAALWGQNSAFAAFMARVVPWGVFGASASAFASVFAVTKSSKAGIAPFQSRGTLIHTPRTRWLCPGCLLRKPPDGIDRRRTSVGRIRFGSGFSEGLQRFNAGWSSPVARQAHNLKVIGSNPIPATRKEPVNSMSWRAFSCSSLPKSSSHGPFQQMLANTRLSDVVASRASSSMSHVWHMERGALFAKRSGLGVLHEPVAFLPAAHY